MGPILLLLPLYAIAPFVAAAWIRVAVVEAFEAQGPSMEPSVLDGDRFTLRKSAYGFFMPFMPEASLAWAAPEPGDIVVVHSPHDDIDIVKRVIAGPGQTIEIRDDEVFVDGASILDGAWEPCPDGRADCVVARERIGARTWRVQRSPVSYPDTMPPFEVPAGHVYVLGDHRDRSNDSRRIGAIPVRRVKGRASSIYWSNDGGVRWDRIGESLE